MGGLRPGAFGDIEQFFGGEMRHEFRPDPRRVSSSNSAARETRSPSPRRPSCRRCRRFPGATSRDRSAGSSVARCFGGSCATAARTRTARSPRSTRSAGDSVFVSTCSRSSIGSVRRRLRRPPGSGTRSRRSGTAMCRATTGRGSSGGRGTPGGTHPATDRSRPRGCRRSGSTADRPSGDAARR